MVNHSKGKPRETNLSALPLSLPELDFVSESADDDDDDEEGDGDGCFRWPLLSTPEAMFFKLNYYTSSKISQGILETAKGENEHDEGLNQGLTQLLSFRYGQ